jgi:hypothetical protein
MGVVNPQKEGVMAIFNSSSEAKIAFAREFWSILSAAEVPYAYEGRLARFAAYREMHGFFTQPALAVYELGPYLDLYSGPANSSGLVEFGILRNLPEEPHLHFSELSLSRRKVADYDSLEALCEGVYPWNPYHITYREDGKLICHDKTHQEWGEGPLWGDESPKWLNGVPEWVCVLEYTDERRSFSGAWPQAPSSRSVSLQIHDLYRREGARTRHDDVPLRGALTLCLPDSTSGTLSLV